MRHVVTAASSFPLLVLLLLHAGPGFAEETPVVEAPAEPTAAIERQLLEGMVRYRLDAAGEEADPLRPVFERMLEDGSRTHAERSRDVLEALRERIGIAWEAPRNPVAVALPVPERSPLAPAEALRREAIDRNFRTVLYGRGPGSCCACGTPFQVSDLRLGRDAAPSSALLTWNPSAGASFYNVYAGSLTNLADLTCSLPDLTATSVVDSSVPSPLLLYLVSAESCGESGLGDATAGPRVPPQTCP